MGREERVKRQWQKNDGQKKNKNEDTEEHGGLRKTCFVLYNLRRM